MDRYTDSMIGRGPTLCTDNDEMMTGSVHLTELAEFLQQRKDLLSRIRTSKQEYSTKS